MTESARRVFNTRSLAHLRYGLWVATPVGLFGRSASRLCHQNRGRCAQSGHLLGRTLPCPVLPEAHCPDGTSRWAGRAGRGTSRAARASPLRPIADWPAVWLRVCSRHLRLPLRGAPKGTRISQAKKGAGDLSLWFCLALPSRFGHQVNESRSVALSNREPPAIPGLTTAAPRMESSAIRLSEFAKVRSVRRPRSLRPTGRILKEKSKVAKRED